LRPSGTQGNHDEKEQVLAHMKSGGKLVDVRSPDEFSGKKTHMPVYPQEGVLRGGHIPGARSVPWAKAANPDGSFKTADDLRTIYEKEQGLKASDDVIAYCRIGERSSHTWFVLTYLLGYPGVRTIVNADDQRLAAGTKANHKSAYDYAMFTKARD